VVRIRPSADGSTELIHEKPTPPKRVQCTSLPQVTSDHKPTRLTNPLVTCPYSGDADHRGGAEVHRGGGLGCEVEAQSVESDFGQS